ncbi:hypothetical protein CKO15_08875 [Halorhodospira abdelmalekii]|nr:hypothetical protein [Halorhodospira abdelmalekii]
MLNRLIKRANPTTDPDNNTPTGVSFDHDRTDQQLQRWQRVLRRTRLSSNLLSLAWTAGPVTALGLTGGYMVAYGKLPHTQLLIYFVTFSVLSGVIGLLAKIVYDSTWGSNKERAQAEVEKAIDRLGELILATRDLDVESLEGNARRFEAARQLLRRIDLSPEGVALASEDLTNDRELGRFLAQIDNYRRCGLRSRIRDLNIRYEEHFTAVYERIRHEAPLAAAALRDRFYGHVPRLRDGIPRNEAFIERALAAFTEQNALLLTMSDVEEMLGLAFELLNGREITILSFTYGGRWRFAKAFEALERARSRYRLALAASDNRLRALAAHLVEEGALPYERAAEELPSATLLERITAVMNQLKRRIDAYHRYAQHRRLTREQRTELRQRARTLSTAVALYRAAHEAIQTLGSAHAELIRASQAWDALTQQQYSPDSTLRIGPGRLGLRIVERTLSLDEEACEDVSHKLLAYLGEEPDRRVSGSHQAHPYAASQSIAPLHERLTPSSARDLAIEVALALEPHIQLSAPEVQRGLAATQASYLGDLEPGMSTREKRRLGEAMAHNVADDLGRAAEQLALALVRHYHVELTEEAKHFLEERYGARPAVLETIARSQVTDQGTQISLLSRRPPPVRPPRRSWYRSLVRARRLLS